MLMFSEKELSLKDDDPWIKDIQILESESGILSLGFLEWANGYGIKLYNDALYKG